MTQIVQHQTIIPLLQEGASHYIEHPDIQVDALKNGWYSIRLNRPKSLNALDEQLVIALHSIFQYLHEQEQVRAVWFDSSTDKAFCAGGDVRKLRQAVLDHRPDQVHRFFKYEYALDALLHHYTKPIVVWGEGYIMGGGLGLFMAAPFRLVTPHSRLAMPEINIGLYPDVGATRFLADRGVIGLFIGLTGSMVSAASSYGIGWATHICDQGRELVQQRLLNIHWQDYPAGSYRAIDDTLNGLHRPLAVGPLQNSLDVIHSVCQAKDFIQDYQAIANLNNARSDWLRQASENLTHGSPSTAAITWLLWQWAQQYHPSWDEVYALEEEISMWKVQHPDFVEGVRARLVDKDLQPYWQTQDVTDFASIFASSVPISQHNQNWNAVLQHYGIK